MNVVVDEEFIKEHQFDPEYYEVIYRQYEDLIHDIAHKYFLKGFEYEDLFSEGVVKLFLVIPKWKPELGYKFSTFLGHSLHRHYQTLVRKQRAVKRWNGQSEMSFEEPISEVDKVYLKDLLADEHALEPFQMDVLVADDFIDTYCATVKKERDVRVIKGYFLEDKKQHDLAKELDIAQPTVSRIIARNQKKIKVMYEKGNY